jgi:hypothetical protein
MGDTAEATLMAVITGYKEKLAETVLEQFHEDVRVIGSKSDESWTSRSGVVDTLVSDLDVPETITGTLTDLTELTEEELAEKIQPDTYDELGWGWITEEGEVVFNGQTLQGRWSCVVQRFGQANWKVVQSHFSVPEPDNTPS